MASNGSDNPNNKPFAVMERRRAFAAAIVEGRSPEEAYFRAFNIPEGDPRREPKKARQTAAVIRGQAVVDKLIRNASRAVTVGALDPNLADNMINNLREIAVDEDQPGSVRVNASKVILDTQGAFRHDNDVPQHLSVQLIDYGSNNTINAPAGGEFPALTGECHFALPLQSKALPVKVVESVANGSEAAGSGEPPKVG